MRIFLAGAGYVVSFVSVVESRHSRWFGWDYEEA